MDGTRLSPQQRAAWSRPGCTRARIRIDGPLDPARLAAAFARVTTRHEILRARFRSDARLRYPVQVIAPEAALDWQRAADAASDDVWSALHRRFDPERGPLVAVRLVRRGGDRHDLLIATSSLIADTSSMGLVLRELADAYAGSGGAGDEPIQYAQYAEWRNDQVANAPGVPIELPFEGAERGDEVVAEQVEALIDRVLPPAALLAAWQVQLGRILGREEIVVAVAAPGRSGDDVAEVIGPVAGWLPVAGRVDPAEPFAAVARRAERALADCAASEVVPEPGDHVGFVVEDLAVAIEEGGVRWQLDAACGGGGLKLLLAVNERRLTLWYDARRFAREAVEAMVEQYTTLLAEVTTTPAAPVRALRMLGTRERTRRLADGGGGCRDDAAPFLHVAFAAHAARDPDAPAVVCGDETLTRAVLDQRANGLAHRLVRRGIATGQPVGLCCERSPAAIVGLLGILKAGAAYVPLDPHAPPQRLADQVRAAGLEVVLTDDDLRVVDRDPAPDPACPVHADALASVVFTSGSTGVPKGVAITHRGIAAYTASVCGALGLTPGLHLATVSTLTADLGNTSIFAALATGGCLHLVDHATATDGARFADYQRVWPIDVLKIVPSHLAALLDAVGAAVLPRRLLVLGGETLPLALVDRIRALAPDCAVANHYGPTETTVGALVLPLSSFTDRRGCASVPIGRPLAHAEAYVLDEQLEPATTGAAGELYLGGAALARGYLGRPDLAAERFVPHPFRDGGRLYRTGDRGRYRPDGTIEFLGRVDHQLKIRGFRVELGEIEARLREHPAVAQAAVVAHDGSTLIAYVVPRAGFDEAELRTFLRARLPDYMMPARVVTLRSLPLTPNGKLDRRALPSPVEAPRTRVAPRTAVESAIVAIWADLLAVPDVGIDDDFFALGGHSLLAIRLMHRIQQALGRSLPLDAIFAAPTVAALAARLDASAPTSAFITLRDRGGGPALYCFDPTGRHVSAYQPLADAVDRPVFGVDLGPRLAATGPSIARITERLARELRAHRPTGAFHLLGWSLGGVLALGTAHVLEALGAEVASIGIVDTQPRLELYADGAPDPILELAGYVDPARRAELLALPAADLQALRRAVIDAPPDLGIAVAIGWAQARGYLPADEPLAGLTDRYALLRDAAQFLNALPRPSVRAPLQVWWSDETVARVDWRPFTSATVDETRAEGDHVAAVRAPSLIAHLRGSDS